MNVEKSDTMERKIIGKKCNEFLVPESRHPLLFYICKCKNEEKLISRNLNLILK